MSNPWKKIAAPSEVKDLSDIISEEIARGLQVKEELKFVEQLSDQHEITSKDIPRELLQELEQPNVNKYCDSDVIIPKVLQFDRKCEDELKLVGKEHNGDTTVSVSYDNNFNVPQHLINDSDSEDDDFNGKKKDCYRFETNEKEFGYQPRRGYVLKDGKLITQVEQTRHHQTSKQKMLDRKESDVPAEMGLDEPTRLILSKLISNGVLDDISGTIATGKKSVVLHAKGNINNPDLIVPKECAIKVFRKEQINELKIQDMYIEADYHLKDCHSKQNPRKTVQTWSEKEMHNMIKMKNIGLNCPDIVCLKKHVLVMSFLGKDNKPALKLKEVLLKPEQWQSIYNEVVESIHKLYNVGHLIHAKLSEHNILWWDNKCWFTGVSESVQPDHPNALRLLFKDCRSISNFFKRKGVADVIPDVKLFKSITGFDNIDLNFLKLIRTSYNPLSSRFEIALDDNRNISYPFQCYWQKSSETKDKSDKRTDE